MIKKIWPVKKLANNYEIFYFKYAPGYWFVCVNKIFNPNIVYCYGYFTSISYYQNCSDLMWWCILLYNICHHQFNVLLWSIILSYKVCCFAKIYISGFTPFLMACTIQIFIWRHKHSVKCKLRIIHNYHSMFLNSKIKYMHLHLKLIYCNTFYICLF